MRTTKNDLEDLTAKMNRVTGRAYFISYAYGKARLVMRDGDGVRDISPRTSKGAVAAWIWAWLAGFEMAVRTMEDDGVNLKIYLDAWAGRWATNP